MKKKIIDKIILKAGASLLSFGMLLGSLTFAFPMQVSAAELDHDQESGAVLQSPIDTLTENATEVFDPYVTPENVSGKIFMGTEALKNPVAKTYSENGIIGTYYEPQTYVYFGSAYSSNEKNEVPILLRVLDSEKDNAGNSGAMFVMSEHASFHTIFSQYRKYDAEIWYGMYGTENVYNLSILHHLIGHDIVTDDYRGSYKSYFGNLAEELDYIRPVTVVEQLAALDGIYGYGKDQSLAWELDSRTPETEVYAQNNEQIAYVDGDLFFPLSAEEMSKYVSTVPYAPGMATTVFGTDTAVKYWLRTGLDNLTEEAENGNFVGAVDENGNVIPLDAGEDAYVRYGFNIETDDIQFMYALTPNTYRLTFIDPTYKAAIENADPENGIDDRFTARVLDVREGLVTVEVGNAIRNRLNTTYGAMNDEQLGISVMIKDRDGNVTHYAQITDHIFSSSSGDDPSLISKDLSKAYFRLPADFDHDKHEVYVFWEMSQEEEGGATFISNMAKLDCLHPGASKPDCKRPAICPDCGEFGEADESYHANVDTSVYYTDRVADTHWNLCGDCGKEVNVEKCTFGDNCNVDCVCGNNDYPSEQHSFNKYGVCEANSEHFESPTLEFNDNVRHVTVRIDNEGQFIAFAKMFNNGDLDSDYDFSIFIERDLDFAGIDGFEPIGTENHPFDGYLSGKNFTVRNIDCSTDGKYAGLFGYVKNVDVRYLNVENCKLSSAEYAAILVGKVADDGGDTVRFDSIEIIGCTVDATNESGKEGILIGEACDGITVYNVYSYDVKNSEDQYARFFSNPKLFKDISVSRSACIYSERGSFGEFDAAAYASGEVAHLMGKGQVIGTDEYPSTDTPNINDGTRVFKVTDCAGDLLRYTNEYLSVHYLRDYTEHRITKFHEFIWDDSLPVAEARVYCDACKQDILITAEMTIVESHAPVRVDYVASVVVNGEKISSDPKRFVGTKLEDRIGMTNKVVEFDGSYVYTEYVLDNYKLVDNPPGLAEFEAYFLDPETGERLTELQYDYYGQPQQIPAGVYLPGSYDLLVVGKRAFEGQEYVYEDALTITPITITVTVADVYKYYDGSASFEPVFTTDNDNYGYILDIVVSDAPSSEVGIYELNMGIEFWDDSFAEGVEVIFSKDTVQGYIFPQLQPSVENKNYPTEFTYGDILPDPSANNFTASRDCELEFSWFKVEYDYYGDIAARIKLDSKPINAGEYLLRVTATGQNHVTYVYELPVEILKKELSLKVEGAEIIKDEYGTEIYVVDMYQTPKITIEGFVNGDTAESVGAFITYYQGDNYYGLPKINDRYVFPYQPNDYYYDVWIYGEIYNYLWGNCNYEKATDLIYVKVKAPEYPTPVFGMENMENGEKQEFGVVYSWTHPVELNWDKYVYFEGTIQKDGEYFGSFEIRGDESDVEQGYNTLKITDAGEYSINIKALYAYGDGYVPGYDVNISFTVGMTTSDGEMLDSIEEIGDYTVSVTSPDGTVREIEATVCREIYLEIKPFDYEMSEGAPEFDIKNFVMQAGKVVLLGHEIVDVSYDFYPTSGRINVNGVTVVDKEGRDVSHLYKVKYVSTDIHVFDSPCDATCNVSYCEYLRVAHHTGGTATCNTLAVCTECGMEYGSYQPHRHTSENTVFSPSSDDKMSHNQIYTCCGAIKSTEGHTPAVAATCTSLAICAECNWAYGDFDPDNHSSDEISYKLSAEDLAMHVGTHKCCNASFTEEHVGGKASCSALAICDMCGAGYGEFDPNHHVNVTYTNVDSAIHGAKCNDCSAEWQDAHAGGNATCIDLAICDACKTAYGELDDENHVSDEKKYVLREENPSMHDYVHSCCGKLISKAYHSGGEANCASAAICEYCGEQYGNKNPENHASDQVAYKQDPSDPLSHIKYHACCKVDIAVEPHNGAGTANCEHGDICDVCMLEYSEKSGHVYDDEKDTQCNVCGKEVEVKVIEPIKTNGCSGTVGFSAVIIITVSVVSLALTFKKKKD